ncbi:sulfite exporter TauE/SafE family protein [Neisseria sp. Ec49-e6-T10]|uniref:sulfite exporter TauE/SafE family protein n=1 Tax=Neisseria sp. Ec49-e6-T10 TaxID=3140744 RepID=UPI003EB7EA7E
MLALDILIPLIAAGAFTGFIAGLFGVGGGMVIVPIVLWLLHRQDPNLEYAQHIAAATSLAVMVFTNLSSVYAQNKRGAVRWDFVRSMALAIVMGTFFGAWSSKFISNGFLQTFFVIFAYFVAFQNFFPFSPTPKNEDIKILTKSTAGGVIGLLSSWVGIGGGTLSVPFLVWCRVPIQQAIGTSSALGWPVALAGTVGYIVSGLQVQGLPEGSLGFVYFPAVLILAIATVALAPLGVKVAHKLPAKRLKQVFGVFLMIVATRMAWQVWFS